MRSYLFGLLFLSLMLTSCGEDEVPVEQIEDEVAFNFIGHPRMSNIGEINPQLLNVNWKEKGPLVLGGDLDKETAINIDVLNSYDDVLEFSDPNTILSLGNHDYANLEDWETLTGRKTFYTTTLDKTVFFISDNQSDKGSLKGEQLELFDAVMDSISDSNTFIFLSHKLLWLSGNAALTEDLNMIPNGGAGDCWHCTNENNFYQVVYPKLVELKNKGIQVICLAGDVGKRVSFYERQTEDNIYFLANGWELDNDSNEYLKFYSTANDSLRWALLSHDE